MLPADHITFIRPVKAEQADRSLAVRGTAFP